MILPLSCSIWNLAFSQIHCFPEALSSGGYFPDHIPSYHSTQRWSRCLLGSSMAFLSHSFSLFPKNSQLWISYHQIVSPATISCYIYLSAPRSQPFILPWFSVCPHCHSLSLYSCLNTWWFYSVHNRSHTLTSSILWYYFLQLSCLPSYFSDLVLQNFSFKYFTFQPLPQVLHSNNSSTLLKPTIDFTTFELLLTDPIPMVLLMFLPILDL